MLASNWRSWLRWAILVPCLTGCQGFSASQGPPHDPLFRSKTPVAAKAEYAPPVTLAYMEPTPPNTPLHKQNAPVIVDHDAPKVPGTLTNRPGSDD